MHHRTRPHLRLGLAALAVALAAPLAAAPAAAFTRDPIIAGWLPAWAGADGRASYTQHPKTWDELLLFWYALSDEGTLTVDSGAEDRAFIRAAQANGTRVYMTVRNGFVGKRFHDLVSDPTKRDAHIRDLLAKLDAFDYDGIDVDFEGLQEQDRAEFTRFITDLAREVHSRNKLLSVAIQAKSYEPGPYASTRAQDWKAIGAQVDRFRVMTYDKNYSGSGAGPVAPLVWMQDIMKFGVTQVDGDKLMAGFPAYGYNWPRTGGGRVSSVTWEQAVALVAQYQVTVGYDQREKAPFFSYTTQEGTPPQPVIHDVWFENAAAYQDKVNALKDLAIGGVAVWRLGGEDPGGLTALESARAQSTVRPFADVAAGSLAAPQIEELHRRGVVGGGGATDFQPWRSITRAETLKVALGHLRLPTLAGESGASDVPAGSWQEKVVATARVRGIASGGSDGRFRPNDPITRAEALKVLLRARRIPEGGSARLPADVPADAWYAGLLKAAVDRGIVRGDASGNFRPNDPITRAELVAILTR